MRKIPPAYRSVLSRGAGEWCSAKMKMLTNATYASETSFISAWGYKVESKRARYRARCDDKNKFWFFSTLPVSLAHTSRDSLRGLCFFLSLITWNLREICSTHRNAATATLVVGGWPNSTCYANETVFFLSPLLSDFDFAYSHKIDIVCRRPQTRFWIICIYRMIRYVQYGEATKKFETKLEI